LLGRELKEVTGGRGGRSYAQIGFFLASEKRTYGKGAGGAVFSRREWAENHVDRKVDV